MTNDFCFVSDEVSYNSVSFYRVYQLCILLYQVVVLGGSGFVGSAICKAAVSKGIEVISLSRCKFIQNLAI
mgnify:CR=1 FL=1